MSQSVGRQRLGSFSDGVFAVIITIMVLQLKLPPQATFGALLAEWPTALSYAVSYLLIAIMWINHHFLLRFAHDSTPRLILSNFVHMFAASLVPFATAWVADTRFAAVPVFVYAAVIVFVNLSYHAFAYSVLPKEGLVTCVLLTYARPERRPGGSNGCHPERRCEALESKDRYARLN